MECKQKQLSGLVRNKIKHRKKYKIGKSPTPLGKITIVLRGYLQGSENDRVVTIDHKEDCVFNAHAHVAVDLSVLAINKILLISFA
jgi:hypothetical protein